MFSSVTKQILAIFTFFSLSAAVQAQDQERRPIEARGSGRLVQETRTLKPFTELQIEYLHGEIKVEVGGTTPTLEVRLDDNLKPFLLIEEKDGKLKLSLRDKQGAPVWTSNATITMVIKTPALQAMVYGANGKLSVTGLTGTTFSLVNKANGRVTVQGTADNFQVVNMANGFIDAEALAVQEANVVSKANGTVRINANEVNAVNSGHGRIINVAKKS